MSKTPDNPLTLQAKSAAERVRERFKALGFDITQGQALEAVAAAAGHGDWHAHRAALVQTHQRICESVVSAQELDALAQALGLSTEDREMVQALGDPQFSFQAMQARWAGSAKPQSSARLLVAVTLYARHGEQLSAVSPQEVSYLASSTEEAEARITRVHWSQALDASGAQPYVQSHVVATVSAMPSVDDYVAWLQREGYAQALLADMVASSCERSVLSEHFECAQQRSSALARAADYAARINAAGLERQVLQLSQDFEDWAEFAMHLRTTLQLTGWPLGRA